MLHTVHTHQYTFDAQRVLSSLVVKGVDDHATQTLVCLTVINHMLTLPTAYDSFQRSLIFTTCPAEVNFWFALHLSLCLCVTAFVCMIHFFILGHALYQFHFWLDTPLFLLCTQKTLTCSREKPVSHIVLF